jgi:hypothetical protein
LEATRFCCQPKVAIPNAQKLIQTWNSATDFQFELILCNMISELTSHVKIMLNFVMDVWLGKIEQFLVATETAGLVHILCFETSF